MFRSLTLTILRGIVPVAMLLSALLSSSKLYLGMWLCFCLCCCRVYPPAARPVVYCLLVCWVANGQWPPNTLKDSIQRDEQQEGTHDNNTNRNTATCPDKVVTKNSNKANSSIATGTVPLRMVKVNDRNM
jgi:hypothetical protein